MCRTLGVTHALEVGTLGGESAIWLANEILQLHPITVESDVHQVEFARRNIQFVDLSERSEVIHGTGLNVLPRLKEEVILVCGKRPQFGFVFIDADKANNWTYFNLAADMSKPKQPICVDNVVRGSRVADLDDRDLRGREVIDNAGRDPRVDSVVIQTVGEKNCDGCL
jgi:predicted O-methyltransferase YrrM